VIIYRVELRVLNITNFSDEMVFNVLKISVLGFVLLLKMLCILLDVLIVNLVLW
jgi:hypothetical protein